MLTDAAEAQFSADTYEDYGAFSTDPVELDQETAELFGRFFQTNFFLGTGIHTGELGQAYAPGLLAGIRFIFFFDRMWAAELGAGFGQNSGLYDERNTNTSNIEIQTKMNLIPLTLGFRYGFNQDALTRGFATMNPYLSATGEILFRNEAIIGTPIVDGLAPALQAEYGAGAIKTNSGFGLTFGGGMEFDVYRKRVFLGLDLRYHAVFWSNAQEFFGELGRTGHYITVLGTVAYNY